MARVLTRLLALTALLAACPHLSAQVIPTAAPPAPAPALEAPRTALVPVQPRLPPPAEAPPNLPGPYFEHDPLVDHPNLPPLGWFGEIDAALLDVHVKRQSFINAPPLPGGGFVPQGQLDWAVSPRGQVGYRLPEGFGEFSVSFRFLSTEGGDTLFAEGLVNLRDRLDFETVDLDYASNEISLWPDTEMRWRLGVRIANAYFDSRQSTPFGLAVPPDGVTDRRFTNWFGGAGPVFGLQLIHRLPDSHASLLCRIDGASIFGRINESYSQNGVPDAAGAPRRFSERFSSSQDVPILNVQVGLTWQFQPAVDAFFGYQFESWWNVGRLGKIDSRGEFQDQGIIARLSLCW